MGQSAQMSLAVIFNHFPLRVLSHKPIWTLNLLPFVARPSVCVACLYFFIYTPQLCLSNRCVRQCARRARFLSPIHHDLDEQIDAAVGFLGDL